MINSLFDKSHVLATLTRITTGILLTFVSLYSVQSLAQTYRSSEWVGTVTGLPPLVAPNTYETTATAILFDRWGNNPPYIQITLNFPGTTFRATTEDLTPQQTNVSFNGWDIPQYPGTMTELTLSGVIGGRFGNTEGIPSYRYQLVRADQGVVVQHFHQLPANLLFASRRLLNTYAKPGNTFYVCADGSIASIFKFSGQKIDYSTATVRIAENTTSDTLKYGRFTVLSQTSQSLEVLYRHPAYVNSLLASTTFNMVLSSGSTVYTQQNLEVVRSPVVMVHGLNSSQEAFKKMYDQLSLNWGSGFFYRCDYQTTNTRPFATNSQVVPNGINSVLQQAVAKGYAAGKATVIGHSMGGLLTRLYLQSDGYRDDINKLITLNTPHSGSHLASLGVSLLTTQTEQIRNLRYAGVHSLLDEGAVTDLALNSKALTSLNQPGPVGNLNRNKVPIHALATVTPPVPLPVDRDSSGLIKTNVEIGLFNLMGINYDTFYGGKSDLVVALSSQLGGLSGTCTTTITQQQHIGSPDNPSVINRTLELLRLPPYSAEFCTSGYNPLSLTLAPLGFTATKERSNLPNQATVHINQPIAGKVVPGNSVVQLQATGSGLSSLWVFIPYTADSLYYGSQSGNTASMGFTVDSKVGKRYIVAIGKAADGTYVSDTSYFYVENQPCESLQSGNWSSPTVWSCGHVPTYLDKAVIRAGHVITHTGKGYAMNLRNEGTLVYSANSQLSINVQPPASLRLSGNLDFGQVLVGQTVSRTLVIQNNDVPLTITGLTLPTGFSGSWTGVLAQGSSQSVVITFTASTAGTLTERLSVITNPVASGNTATLTASVTAVNLTNGLVLYLPFSGNANDASGNGNHGLVTGATLTTDRSGNLNQAYNFTRSNSQFISVPHAASLDLTGSILTISGWVKPNWSGSSGPMQILSKAQNTSSTGRKFGLYTRTVNSVGFELRTGAGTVDQDWSCPACSLQENVWQFITVTYNGSAMKWYKNGVLLYQVSQSGNIVSSTTDLTIGSFSDKAQSFFNGSLDEIRIYNRVLTDMEINALYQL